MGTQSSSENYTNDFLLTMSTDEADSLIYKIRHSEHILVIVGAGLSRPSGIPTFRDDPWFWERPIEDSASETAFKRDPIYVWAVYERLRLIARSALPNAAHAALARLASVKPKLLTISQNIDDLLQRAHHKPDQLVSLHGSLFKIHCENKECAFEDANYTAEPTVPGLKIHPSGSLGSTVASLPLRATDIPSCPHCHRSKLRPGVCWFGEKLPLPELSRVENWFQDAAKVDLVLVIGTERTPFVEEAIAKGAEVAWLNTFDSELVDVGDDWYVSGCITESLTQLVEAALR